MLLQAGSHTAEHMERVHQDIIYRENRKDLFPFCMQTFGNVRKYRSYKVYVIPVPKGEMPLRCLDEEMVSVFLAIC